MTTRYSDPAEWTEEDILDAIDEHLADRREDLDPALHDIADSAYIELTSSSRRDSFFLRADDLDAELEDDPVDDDCDYPRDFYPHGQRLSLQSLNESSDVDDDDA